MRKILFIFAFILTLTTNAQLVVNNTTLSPAQLIENVLLGGGVSVFNISYNGTSINAQSPREQVARFIGGNTVGLGINNGLLLAIGNAKLAAISPTNKQLINGSLKAETALSNFDIDLATLQINLDQVSVLEFDFIPQGNVLNFEYVFASEEYPDDYQNSFYDVFGFFISGPGIDGVQNIAQIPNTTLPVAIPFINPSTNSDYYNPNSFPNLLQYDGFTDVFTATANVECGETYHIKLAIANVGDNSYDSAVFLKGGSFNVIPLNLGADLTGENSVCGVDKRTFNTGLANTIVHEWYFNGVLIPNETKPTITINKNGANLSGTYTVIAYPFGASCPVSDSILVSYATPSALVTPPSLEICNNVSPVVFNLNEQLPIMFNGLDINNYEYGFYLTEANAYKNLNMIPASQWENYSGTSGQTIYFGAKDLKGTPVICTVVTSFILKVVNCDIVQPKNMFLCDKTGVVNQEPFFFNTQTAVVLGANKPANFNVTYHLSLNDANSDLNPIDPLIAYLNTSNPQTIYVRMESVSNSSNFSTTTFQIIVSSPPTVVLSINSKNVCSGNSASLTFNGTPNASILFTIDGVVQSPVILDVLGKAQIFSPILTSDVIIGLTSVTLDCTTDLTSVPTQTINVLPIISASVSGQSICENKSTNVTFSGPANSTITYTVNNGIPQQVIIEADGTTDVSTGILTSNAFYQLVNITSNTIPTCTFALTGNAIVMVNKNPIVTATPASQTICSASKTNIILTSQIPNTQFTYTVLSQTNISGATGGTGPTIADNLSTLTAADGSVTYSIIPTANGCSGDALLVTVTIRPKPELLGVSPQLPICSGESTNIILNASIPGTVFNWTVKTTPGVEGASAGTGSSIIQTLLNNTNTQGTATYTVIPILNGCEGTPVDYPVIVNEPPSAKIDDGLVCANKNSGVIYKTYTLNTGISDIDASNFVFEWFTENTAGVQTIIAGATGPTYEVEQQTEINQIYFVKVKNSLTNCEITDSAVVRIVYPAIDFNYIVTDAFTSNTTIKVFVVEPGTGKLQYSLDDDAPQDSNIFTNVEGGLHEIVVTDLETCTFISKKVIVVDYMNYFTPDGDGYNDTWKIVGLNANHKAKIYIFDRYGKLLKQIDPLTNEGWDGKLNGINLPSTDYWFKIEYIENLQQKEFKSHFTLKR